MAMIPGRKYFFTQELRSDAYVVALPLTATVSAVLLDADGVTPLSASIPVLPGSIGANWQAGIVVVEISAANTNLASAPRCAIVVTVTMAGQSRDWLSFIDVDDGVIDNTALFYRDAAISKFRANRMSTVIRYTGGNVSDDYIWEKLVAAETDAQRELHVFFRPTVLFPNDPTDAEVLALNGAAWAVDPGYDLEQDVVQPGGWSFLVLRQKPIITLESIKFSYPSMGTVFTVPSQWIKVDKKYGHVRFIPTSNAFTTPIGGMMVGAMGMQGAPQFIEVRYTAGLKNAATDFPDLIDLVQRMAALRMMGDAMIAASTSISADGLSQSSSAPDMEKMQASVDKSLETLRQRIHGVPLMVL